MVKNGYKYDIIANDNSELSVGKGFRISNC